MRAVAVGLLALMLVVTGAMPAAAGPPGPEASGGGRTPAGHAGSGGEPSGVSAKQVEGGSAPARKHQGAAPRPPRQRAAAPRKVARSAAAPSAGRTPHPAERKPDAQKPDRPDDGPQPQRPRTSPAPSPSPRPRTEVRSSTASPAARTASRPDRPRPVRSTSRPTAAVVASSADPTAALFPPPVVHLQAAAVELEPRQLWPSLPGAAGHPAFPALLAAVLVGFVVLGIRGDRRDPKLAAAAIDDRDDRATFR